MFVNFINNLWTLKIHKVLGDRKIKKKYFGLVSVFLVKTMIKSHRKSDKGIAKLLIKKTKL